jgi:predicted amidohydrolase
MNVRTSVIQVKPSGIPEHPDETVRDKTLRQQIEDFKEAFLAPQMALAEEALSAGSDLIVLREDCNGAGWLGVDRYERPDLLRMAAETIPGQTSQRLGELARRGGCYVCGCWFELEDGKIYNTAVLLDPHGKPVGKYRKTHLPPVEKLLTTPGNELPVFSTEIGNVGMLICYDMMSPEVARCLALQGADVLLWPSLGYGWWDESGDFTVQSRAHDNQVYILGALPSFSCIVDPYGEFLASARQAEKQTLTATITPGVDPLQDELHHNTYITQTPSLRERHLFERRPELYQAIVEAEPKLMKRYPRTHMRDLENDREGSYRRYRAAYNRLHWQTRKDRHTS